MHINRQWLVFATLLLTSCTYAPHSEEGTASTDVGLTLDLIHINDTHSQFDASPGSVDDADGKTLYTFIGGHPRLLTQAKQFKRQAAERGIPALFLHGGDAFKGSAYFELFEQRINIDVLNRMGIDAMAMGNHEFDIGLSKLADFIDKVNFPLLAANIDSSAEPLLQNSNNLKPFQLFVVNNNQLQRLAEGASADPSMIVAVFGLALQDMRAIAPDTGKLIFSNEVATAQRTVDALTARGIRHIIALTHLGNQRDLALAHAVNGIDVIVGGHSHSLLGDFRHWHLGQQGPYAEMITNADGQSKTCVVQAGKFAQAIGQALLKFNTAGELTSCVGENTLLASAEFYRSAKRDAASRIAAKQQATTERFIAQLPHTAIVPEDRELRQLLDERYLPDVKQAYGELLTISDRNIEHVRLPGSNGSDEHGSELAGYIADAMLNWLNRPQVQAVTGKVVDFSLIGAGNIRAPLQAGNIYAGNISLEVLPFNTPLSVLTVSGQQLRQLLTQTIGATLVPGAHAGKYPYTGALRYVAQQTGVGEVSITTLQLWRDNHWQDIENEARYSLATTQYLADGNDGWQLLQQVQQTATDRVDVILQQQQVAAFAVKRVQAQRDSSGEVSYKAQYQTVAALPCHDSKVNCKVAAQAMIDYIKANPTLFEQPRAANVTLLRQP